MKRTDAFNFFIVLVFGFFSSLAFAKELTDMSLEELLNVKVISATRTEANALKLPSAVTVITGKELTRWGAENLADALRYAAGMQVRKAPGDFPQYEAVIRGNTADFMNIRTLFLIDGVPIRNPNAGFDPSWLPIAAIKSVEIVKGPASNLYGANAFGGVVNVITMSGADMPSKADASLGYRTQHDLVKSTDESGGSGHLNFGAAKGTWDYFTSVQYSGQENSDLNYTGHTNQDLFAKVKKQINDDLRITASTLLSFDRSQVAVPNASAPIKNDVTHFKIAADYKVSEDSNVALTAHLSDFDHFLKYDDAADKYDNNGRIYGVTTQYTKTIDVNQSFIFGGDYTEEYGSLEKVGWDKESESTYGIFTQYEYSGWENYLAVLGARFDSDSKAGNAVSPRLGLSYFLNENATLYSSVSRGFRAPVFNETQINAFGKVGNPDLKPEYTTTYEVGLKTVYMSAQNTISVFKEDISENIDLVASGTGTTYGNNSTATITGIELDGKYLTTSNLTFFYNGLVLDAKNGSGNNIDSVVRNKVVVGASLHYDDWIYELGAIHESESSVAGAPNGVIPENSTADFQVKKLLGEGSSVTVYVKNIADRKYVESYSPFISSDGLYLPGRTVGLTFNTSF